MKKLVSAGVAILLLISGNMAIAQSNPDATPPAQSSRETLQTEKINDIDVPYSILLDAQMEFQGYAVTDAHKSERNGHLVYTLRMDQSDTRSRSSFYLNFDSKWEFIGREQAPPPEPKIQPNTEDPKSEDSHQDENDANHDNGGNNVSNDDEKPEEDEEQVEEDTVVPAPRHGRKNP